MRRAAAGERLGSAGQMANGISAVGRSHWFEDKGDLADGGLAPGPAAGHRNRRRGGSANGGAGAVSARQGAACVPAVGEECLHQLVCPARARGDDRRRRGRICRCRRGSCARGSNRTMPSGFSRRSGPKTQRRSARLHLTVRVNGQGPAAHGSPTIEPAAPEAPIQQTPTPASPAMGRVPRLANAVRCAWRRPVGQRARSQDDIRYLCRRGAQRRSRSGSPSRWPMPSPMAR